MDHSKTFREQLAIQYPTLGRALWEPDPGARRNNQGYRFAVQPVQVGDVGIIRDDNFCCIFNALLPRDAPSYGSSESDPHYPEYLQQLQPRTLNHIRASTDHRSDFRSRNVTDVSRGANTDALGPDDSTQLTFSCIGRQGALLYLPFPTDREDTDTKRDFEKWILENIYDCMRFAEDRGLGVNSIEDIILVTGRHLARSWVRAVYSDSRGGAEFSFVARASGSSIFRFEQRNVRGAHLDFGPSGENLPENQCIFIRGYSVFRKFNIWPRVRGQAGPAPLPEPEPDKHLQLVSVPANADDPLHTLSEYIAEQNPSCDMVLVHDDDLKCIENAKPPLETLQPDTLMQYLRDYAPKTRHFRCESISRHGNESEAEVTIATVATLSPDVFGELHDEGINPLFSIRTTSLGVVKRWQLNIDQLPEKVLLEIFDFYRTGMVNDPSFGSKTSVEAWQVLIHVCQRWRFIVFGSLHYLDLRLCCTPNTPVKGTLDVWPALPLMIEGDMTLKYNSGMGNILAALEQSNRICRVSLLHLWGWQLHKVLAAMQGHFPVLTDLRLSSAGEMPAFGGIPDSFLDGSALRLRYFSLSGIPFPGLPNLLLSATQLVSIKLTDVPDSGYISSEAMVALISVLTSLKSFSLEFRSPRSRPDRDRETQHLPPSQRSVLPDLYDFCFKGDTGYLEDLVICIDAPGLHRLILSFFDQVDFGCPQLYQFINRTPTFTALEEVHVQFGYGTASFIHRHCSSDTYDKDDNLQIYVSCTEPERQLSAIEQVCNSLSRPLSPVEDLFIEQQYSQMVWENDVIEKTLWLQILLPFTAVRILHISEELAPGIAAALRGLVGARIAEVLPNLKTILVDGFGPSEHFLKNIGQFAIERELFAPPVSSVSDFDKNLNMELM